MVVLVRVRDARREYPGEWVAMRVTRTNAADAPLEGEVVAHDADRRALHEMARRFRTSSPDVRVFIFFAGDPIPEGLAVSLVSR